MNNILNDQYVECPICHKKYKELNTSHLFKHGLTPTQFDDMYPDCVRLSKISMSKKSTLTNISDDLRYKLKKSHTKEGYIEKYGEDDGIKRWNDMKKNKSLYNSKEGYIEKYGEDDGIKRWKEKNDGKSITLEKYISLYGECDGTKKYNIWLCRNKESKTIYGYIKKYGEVDGVVRWNDKNKRNSESSKKYHGSCDDYKLYRNKVLCYTNASVSLYYDRIKNIENRNISNHLDHKYSILNGFNDNVDPKIVGSYFNLCVISSVEV